MGNLIDWIRHALETNMVFSGGFALSLFGGLVAFLYRIPALVWPILKRTFVTQLEFANDDPAYQWILAWLSAQPYLQKTKHIRVLSTLTNPDQNYSATESRQPLFSIPSGLHWFLYKGRFIWITLTKNRIPMSSSRIGSSSVLAEELVISSLFAPNTFISDLVYEAKALYDKRDASTVSLYIPDSWEDSWKKISSKPMRPLTSLVYDENLGEEVLKDLNTFSSSQSWYASMGIPWRRGYLLYGIPGSGKTTLVMALAGELGRDIYILNLSKPELSDDGLIRLLNAIPSGAFLLMEEIDCLFDGRVAKNDKQNLTFSGLLAAIDGVASAEGRVLFMTTNHFEKLDSALTRPGRADVHLHFTFATSNQIIKLIKKFFPERTDDEIIGSLNAGNLGDRKISMAALQETLVAHRGDFTSALLALDTM